MVSSRTATRTARTVHRWMGAFLAMLLILVSTTETLLVWKTTYLGIVFPQGAMTFEHTSDAMAGIAQAAEQAFGADAMNRVEFGDQEFGLGRIYLLDQRSAYIAPDGEILQVWEPNGRPEDWLLDLHHRLLAGTSGLYVVGFCGIATLVLIAAGLIAYWPARRALRLGVVPHGFKRRELSRAHRNTGFWLALPLAVIVLAGIVLAFPEISRTAFMWPYANDDTYGESFGDGVDDLSGTSQASWPNVIARAATVFPNAQITGLVWPPGTGVRRVILREEGEWSKRGHSTVLITEIDGYMDLRIDARTLPIGEKSYNFLGTLHRSELGGRIYDVIQTLIGLGLIYLGIIGLMSFLRGRFSSTD